MKPLLIALAVVIGVPLGAQESREVPRFADVNWGSSRSQTKAQVVAKGYTFAKQDDDGDLQITGNYLGTPLRIVALFTPDNKLAKVFVHWLTPDDDCLAFYRRMKEALSNKYGDTSYDVRRFDSPYYEDDGYEEQAVRVGKGHIFATWSWPTQPDNQAAGLMISVEKNLTVELTYEPPEWEAESQRRQSKSVKDF